MRPGLAQAIERSAARPAPNDHHAQTERNVSEGGCRSERPLISIALKVATHRAIKNLRRLLNSRGGPS